MSFDLAYQQLSILEGGYSDDPRDPGNWTGGAVNSGELNGTQGGISASAYPKLDIKSLTPARIKAIYLSDYWDKIKGDLLPDAVAVALFKEAVNMGVAGATKAFQKSLKVTPDGDLGQITVGIATSQPPKIVLENFLTECAWEYTQMKSFPVYGKGWLSRVIQTAVEAQLSSTEMTPNAVKG